MAKQKAKPDTADRAVSTTPEAELAKAKASLRKGIAASVRGKKHLKLGK